jgi:septal ring factor EnvC (AmiA/AmiB activator)
MADPVSTRMWKLASAALTALAIGAGAFGYLQYRTAATLTEQLTEATAEAQEATDEVSKLRSQLSAAQDRVNSQGQKLTAAEEQVNAERQQLSAVQHEVSENQRQLHSAEARLATESRQEARQEMPIRMTFHDAILRSGKVAVLQNLSDADIEVELDAHSPSTGAHIRQRLVVNAHGMLRFGPQQGWPFAAGQVVTLSNAKYRSIVQTVG